MRSTSRNWMWAEACEFLDRAERVHRQFFRPGEGRSPSWEPPVDIVEDAGAISITVALPGVPPGDLEVGVEGDVLVVAGRRNLPEAFRRATVHRLELPFGRFERRIRLPARRLEVIQRDLVDGCLTLVLRKL